MNHLIELARTLADIQGITPQQLVAILAATVTAAEAIGADMAEESARLAELRVKADARRSIVANALPVPPAAKTRKPRAQKPAPATGDNAA